MLRTLGEVLPRAAAQFGDKTALVIGGRELGFAELDVLSNRLARGLAERGIGAGDRVTLYSPNCWEWLVSYYGVLKTGAVINPINVMLTPEEVAYVVTDCGAKAVLTSAEKGAPILGLKASHGLSEIIMFGDAVPAGATAFDELIARNESDFQVAEVDPDALSTICYTSGTTGHPKGAMHSHRAVLTNAAMIAQMHVRNRHDTVVTALPCPHVYGNVIFNSAMLFGMKLVLHSAFKEEDVLDSIERHRATLFEGVPTMYMYLLNHPQMDKTDLSSLIRCTVGGQPMPAAKSEEFEARVGCPLLELWGMPELAGAGTVTPLDGETRHGSLGLALP